MFKNSIRSIVLTSLLIPNQALACLGPFAEKSIFAQSTPSSTLKSEALIKATLTSVGVKKVVKVLNVIKDKDPTKSIRLGGKIELDYRDSSCGPNHRVGESGMIRVRISGKGNQAKFYPYLYPRFQK